LIARGRQVTVMDRNFRCERVRYLPRTAEAVEVDITDPDALRNALRSCGDARVFHCAALDGGAAHENPSLAFDVNVRGTWNLLEAAHSNNTGQLVLVGTTETFGDHVRAPIGNDDAQFPRTLYGATNVCMERLAEQFARDHGLDCRGLRLPAVMGPGRQSHSASAYTTERITAAALGKPYMIKASPNSRLSLMYIDDAVRALCDFADTDASVLSRRFYNLSGFRASAENLRNAVVQHIPMAQLDFAPYPSVVDSIAAVHDDFDDSLARRDWGWTMRYRLEESVRRFTQAIRNPR
jgi:nucleoside-diphosphate-sugar epimerase